MQVYFNCKSTSTPLRSWVIWTNLIPKIVHYHCTRVNVLYYFRPLHGLYKVIWTEKPLEHEQLQWVKGAGLECTPDAQTPPSLRFVARCCWHIHRYWHGFLFCLLHIRGKEKTEFSITVGISTMADSWICRVTRRSLQVGFCHPVGDANKLILTGAASI